MNSKHEQLNELKEFQIQQTAIYAGLVRTREMIAIRPIVENLNLNWSGAYERIKRDPKLCELFVPAAAVSADGKTREMLCLPIDAFQNWLWGLQVTEKMNVSLWERYKKDLVMTVLMMLKMSLEEIQASKAEKDFLRDTAALSVKYIKEQEELSKMEFETKQKRGLVTELRNEILERQLNHSQLSLFNQAEELNH